MSAKTKMSSFVCVVLCLGVVACLTMTNRTLKVAAAGDEQQMRVAASAPALNSSRSFRRMSYAATKSPGPAQGAQGEKTVDQSRKNIQVLKGLPESQLFLLMNFVATSLGQQCSFCHIQQGKDPKTGLTKWVWESDDKPEKQTARRMMQMVLSIKANDKVDFRENEVTCYTCHRGQKQPTGLPPMPLARSGHEPGPNDAAPSVRTTLPSVEQIFSKYIEAVGGSAVTGTKTMVLKGKREASENRNWPNEITLAAPDKFLLIATTPQGTVRQIVNGDKGWVMNGTNVRSLTPAEAGAAKHSFDELFNIIKVKPSQSMRPGGMQKVGERDAYVVENATDAKTERYYFDSQTGLLLRKMTLNKTVLMPFPEQLDFEDYRNVDGVKVPFTIRYSAIDTYDSWTRTFTDIKRNSPLDDTLFAMPAAPPK
jgi:photosynthetic reaction center cytochrome c subunit